ncbi:glycosyltransferase family 4 protein [Fimbriiglobus ruber]|uniref:Glycosyltransferase, family 4 n=1 Tax=Fimbriiglobus ruber TaxID=1908690 RepID=A0A225E0V0_9BACT|nr:glycosyltransferase family 4 protein [Fimbriiglobus ruber]OWK42305.1 Glycosyltransferase, family 4 [Fimbriiglobus ruber]
MHVALFVHRYPPAVGGCEAYVARLAAHLASCGDGVTVWTSTAVDLEAMWRRGFEETSAAETTSGVTIRRFAPLRFPARRYALKALSLIPVPRWQALTLPCNPVCPEMWRAAGQYDGRLDAVHAFAFPYSFVAAAGLRLARRRGVPFLLTPFLHLGDPTDPADRTRRQYTSAPLRWLLRQADRVFVQTPSEFRAVVELGVPEGRVVLQGLGVDPAECTGGNRMTARAAWGVAPDEVVFGHLANLSEEKGAVDLLRAAAVAQAAGHRFRVVLAGPDMPNFCRFWDALPDKSGITRLGRLTDAEKRDFFAGIDAFALPSRTDSFGLVLLEAWANGKPNVCYRAGGPADLIHDGEDGFLARCGDVAELARHLGRLAADPTLRQKLGETGRARVGRDFRWDDKLELVRRETSRLRPMTTSSPVGWPVPGS